MGKHTRIGLDTSKNDSDLERAVRALSTCRAVSYNGRITRAAALRLEFMSFPEWSVGAEIQDRAPLSR